MRTNETDKEEIRFNRVYKILLCILACVIVIKSVDGVLFKEYSTQGYSMQETIKPGDTVKVQKGRMPEKGDIIVFLDVSENNEGYLIKRCIATPGDTVYISDGYVYLNGEKLDETEYVTYNKLKSPGLLSEPVTLNDGEYIVLGDNRDVSLDSRMLGVIKKENIVGKVVKIFKN